jgi:hypothetical protein
MRQRLLELSDPRHRRPSNAKEGAEWRHGSIHVTVAQIDNVASQWQGDHMARIFSPCLYVDADGIVSTSSHL